MTKPETIGQTLVEVTVTVRLYAGSQALAAVEVCDRLAIIPRDKHALKVIKTETKLPSNRHRS